MCVVVSAPVVLHVLLVRRKKLVVALIRQLSLLLLRTYKLCQRVVYPQGITLIPG
jgi:hypothetical protein